jgi:hypothetical protein
LFPFRKAARVAEQFLDRENKDGLLYQKKTANTIKEKPIYS